MDDRVLGDADRGVAEVRLDQRREHRRDGGRQIVRIEIGLRRHRHVDRLGDAADQRLVVAQTEAGGAGAAIGNVEHLQERRHVHFHEGVVVEALVAEVQNKMRAVGPQLGVKRGVIVEKTKAIIGQLVQCRLEPLDRLDILFVPASVALDRVGKARIAENHGDVGKQRRAARQPPRAARRLAGQKQPVRHHAEILIAGRIRRQQRMKADIGETGAGQQRVEALFRIEPLGIELIGDDAALGMDHDLTADQPIAILGEIALAADEMILVDPFPRARIEMTAHPLAIHQIHDERSAGGEGALDRFEHGEIVLRTLEIAERVAQTGRRNEIRPSPRRKRRASPSWKRDLQVALPGAFAGEADQVARAVEPGDVRKAAPGEFERMAALAAAQIEDAVVALEPDGADQQIDLLAGVAVVLDNVAVGFEIERVEQSAPPIRGQMTLEIGHRTQGARTDVPALLRPVAICTRKIGVRRVRLGSGPRTIRLLAHIHCPRSFGRQKAADTVPEPACGQRAIARRGVVARIGCWSRRLREMHSRSDTGFRLDQRRVSAGSSEYFVRLSR